MTDDFRTSMSNTRKAWDEYIVPVAPRMMRGWLTTVEGRTDEELARILDQLCGIDAFNVDGSRVQGVASRIQVVKKIHGEYRPFNTFTVRESRSTGVETEWKKRIEAMRNGFLCPRLTMQAYVTEWSGGRLLTMAVCLTADLFDFLENNPDKIKRQYSNDDYGGRTSFVCVKWDDMVSCGYPMRILEQDGKVHEYNQGKPIAVRMAATIPAIA